jgi:hypothetical protein
LDLASFLHADWFRLNDTRDGVAARAGAGGITAENSNHRRCGRP